MSQYKTWEEYRDAKTQFIAEAVRNAANSGSLPTKWTDGKTYISTVTIDIPKQFHVPGEVAIVEVPIPEQENQESPKPPIVE